MPFAALPGALRRRWPEILMVAPLVAYIGVLTLAPVLESIRLSLTDRYTGFFPSLDSYQAVLARSDFGAALANTLGITAISVSLELSLGLALALMLARPFRGRGLFRAVALTPLGVPTLVVGAAMLYIVGTNGYLNEALFRLGIIQAPVYWTESGLRGMLVVALADTWKTTPLVALILLAGLESIPQELYEAASVDGANAWQRFHSITWPLLLPSVAIAVVLRAIDAFRIFDVALVMAGQAVPVMSTIVYFDYAAQSYSTAAASGTLLAAMIAAFTGLYLFGLTRARDGQA